MSMAKGPDMLVLGKVRWPALVLTGLCLVGCTTNDSPESAANGRPGTGSEAAGQAPEVPSGSRPIACVDEEAHARSTSLPTDNDLTVGAISWPGLKDWATADPKGFANGKLGDYKVGALVKAGAVVTVAVAEPNKDDAGLKYGQRWDYEPAQSVTFQGCKDYDTAYIGGFHVPNKRCIPFDISEGGKPPVRITVSFFAGPC